MRKFSATATNKDGLRFQFTFVNPNWHSIEQVSEFALAKIVDVDKMHKKLGPWRISNINVAA